MAIKVIIMDIDGTLVNDEKVITPLTKETLLKAQDKGVRLVLASGRPTSGLLKLAEELDMKNHHGLFVCFNGSKVVDCQSHETLYNHAISVEDSKAVLEHLKNFKARPMFDKDEYMYVNDVFDNTIIYMGYKKEEMMAFGDAQNDKSMVEYVGLGVAMGNASDELKAVANEITDTNNNDGIAKAIMKHIEL